MEEKKEKKEKTPVEKLAEEAGVTPAAIYKVAKQMGRLPTLEEMKNRKPGRPRKWE